MAKLIAAAALLVVLLAVSKATAYRTTITTTIIDEENLEQSRPRCRQQMQMMQLQQCKNYMMSQMGQGPFNRVALKMMVEDNNQQQQGQQSLHQCCMELKDVDDECRCDVIKQMVMQQMQEGQSQGQQQMQRMMEQARVLPGKCNMQPSQCQF